MKKQAVQTRIIDVTLGDLTRIINDAIGTALDKAALRPVQKEKEDLMTIDQLVKYTQYSRTTLLGYTRRKDIPFFKRDGSKKLFFSKAAIDQWLKSNPQDSVHK